MDGVNRRGGGTSTPRLIRTFESAKNRPPVEGSRDTIIHTLRTCLIVVVQHPRTILSFNVRVILLNFLKIFDTKKTNILLFNGLPRYNRRSILHGITHLSRAAETQIRVLVGRPEPRVRYTRNNALRTCPIVVQHIDAPDESVITTGRLLFSKSSRYCTYLFVFFSRFAFVPRTRRARRYGLCIFLMNSKKKNTNIDAAREPLLSFDIRIRDVRHSVRFFCQYELSSYCSTKRLSVYNYLRP